MVPRVLVLEPYADLRAEITATLQREHYACDAVATAADAVVQLDQRTYAYVVIDLDTIDSESVMAGLNPSSQVILVSGEDEDRAVLRKPFGRLELLARFTN